MLGELMARDSVWPLVIDDENGSFLQTIEGIEEILSGTIPELYRIDKRTNK